MLPEHSDLSVRGLVQEALSFSERRDAALTVIGGILTKHDCRVAKSLARYFTCGCNGTLLDKLRLEEMEFGGDRLLAAKAVRENILGMGAMLGFPMAQEETVWARIPDRPDKPVTCAIFPLKQCITRLLLSLPPRSVLQVGSLAGAKAPPAGARHGHPMHSPEACQRAVELFDYVSTTALWRCIVRAANKQGRGVLFLPLMCSGGDDSGPVGLSLKRSVNFFVMVLLNVCSALARTEASAFYLGAWRFCRLYSTLLPAPPYSM